MARQKLKNYYDTNKAYAVLKELLRKSCSDDDIAHIWQSADEELRDLLVKYKDAPEGEKRHLNATILPRAAMYHAMKEKISEEETVRLLDETIKITGLKIGHMLDKLTRFPGMDKFFMSVFEKMVKKMFGPDNGFQQTFYDEKKGVLRFDINVCPYYEYSIENDCVPIAHTFCDSDVYCYGQMKKVKFERTGTIGRGADRCDFKLSLQVK